MTLIEKIAKALHDDLVLASPPDGHKRHWETAPWAVKDMCRRQARVALEAAKIPTEAMILAGDIISPDDIFAHEKASNLRYQAMIEAALTEKDI